MAAKPRESRQTQCHSSVVRPNKLNLPSYKPAHYKFRTRAKARRVNESPP
jgi:hypothetical protein